MATHYFRKATIQIGDAPPIELLDLTLDVDNFVKAIAPAATEFTVDWFEWPMPMDDVDEPMIVQSAAENRQSGTHGPMSPA